MTGRDFCYWLQGFFELSDPGGLREAQVDMIKAHLALVFKHEIDPSAGPPAHQADLDAIHDAIKKHEAEKPHHVPQFNNPNPVFRC